MAWYTQKGSLVVQIAAFQMMAEPRNEVPLLDVEQSMERFHLQIVKHSLSA